MDTDNTPLRFIPVEERDAFLSLDADGRILAWNDGAERLFGWRRDEALGRDAAELIVAPDHRAAFAAAWKDFLGAGSGALRPAGNACLTVPGVRKDGTGLNLDVTAIRASAHDGGMHSLVVREAVDPEGLAARYQSLEEQLRIILDASPMRMSYVGTDFRYRFVSGTSANWLGFSPKEMVGRPVEEIIGKDSFERIRANLGPVYAGRTVILEDEFPHPQGGFTYIRLHLIPHFRKEDGRLEGIMTFTLDLTDLKRAEEGLRESTVRLYSIFNNINEVLALVGVEEHDEFRVLEANEHYLAHALSPREKILGQHISGYMPPPVYAVFSALLKRVVETGQPVIREYQSGTIQGSPILELRLTPIRGLSGRVEKILVIGKDQTELRKTEEILRQSQKMEAVGRLAGGIAHDFNNLLTAINGFAEMASRKLGDPEAVRGMLEQIRLSGERAAELTRQLLAFSRKQILLPKLIDLNSVLAAMRTLLLRLVRADIQLSFTLAPGLNPVRMDPGQLEQIILNLVLNACDAMPEGGRLAVETRKVGPDALPAVSQQAANPHGYVLLEVSDTGVGMTPELQARIFEPYFTTKEPGKGTGMGLATVFGILNQSDGSIQVASEPGKGSRFRIFFPAGEAPVEAPAPEPAMPADQAGPTGRVIFLVEDEDPVRDFAKQVLENGGFRIVASPSGRHAMERLSRWQGPLDLLLTDLVMPGMNGPELWAAVKAAHPGTKVLFMSGYMDNEMIPKDLLSADAPFLQKPFTMQQLAAKVKDCLHPAGTGVHPPAKGPAPAREP